MKPTLFFIAAAVLCAQPPIAFEAASIKPNTSGMPGTGMSGGKSQIFLRNASLKNLIEKAYRLHDYAFSGPSWQDAVHFDVTVKLPEGSQSRQYPEMLQTLLAERFKLAAHRELKEVNGLALVVDKKGPKIEPVASGGGVSWGPNLVRGKITIAELVDHLEEALDLPVQDLTQLAGAYDISLRWASDIATPVASEKFLSPSVFAAVRQLGLRLEPRKLAVEILVVDHAERAPSEN